MRKHTITMTALAAAMTLALGTAHAATQPTQAQALANLKADAQALSDAAVVAQTLVRVGNNYAAGFSAYATTQGAGAGQTLTYAPAGLRAGAVLCPNPVWVAATKPLAVGGLNVAGNAMALGYSLQVLATHWSQDLTNLMEAEGATGAANTQSESVLLLNEQASHALAALLNVVGAQTQSAMNPQTTTLAYLPRGQVTGVGDAPVPSEAAVTGSPNLATALGWTKLPERCVGNSGCSPVDAPLPQVCPTDAASIPMQTIGQMTEAVAQQAIADEPSMSGLLSPIIGASVLAPPTQQITASNDSTYSFTAPNFNSRVAMMQTLQKDVVGAAGYIQPILSALDAFNAIAQQITTQVSQ